MLQLEEKVILSLLTKKVRVADISIRTKMASPPFKKLCYDWFLAFLELISFVHSSAILIIHFLEILTCLSAQEGTASKVRCFEII